MSCRLSRNRRLLVPQRQTHDELAPLSWSFTAHLYGASVQRHEIFGDGKAKSQARSGVTGGIARLRKQFKDRVKLIRWNTRPAIEYMRQGLLAVIVDGDVHAHTASTEFHCIAQQIDEYLQQPLR